MSATAEATVPFESSPASDEKKKEPKPTKTLPTNRVAYPKQIEIIRAFGALGGSDRKAASNVDVSKVVNLHAATVGLSVPFLVDCQFLTKGPEGLVPAEEVAEFAGAYEWNADTAFHRVAPILRRTWFYTKLEPTLRFKPLSKADAIQELSLASNASPAYRSQLETLLDYLAQAGIVSLDGDQVRLIRTGPGSQNTAATQEQEDKTVQTAKKELPATTDESRSVVHTSFASQSAGIIQFNISVKVDMTEFAGWEPSRIAAFFAGIAQVLAAKGQVEEKSSKTI